MAVRPTRGDEVTLSGEFAFVASWEGMQVTDRYQLRIHVPKYPQKLPRVFELGGRIKIDSDEHTFPDGQLCLGSELRIRTQIGPSMDLARFADRCLVPYLYATTRRVSEGRYVLGELAHGHPGLIEDYKDLLGVDSEEQVRSAIRALATKASSADRHPCPCGCGKRLAQCEFRERLSEFRKLAPQRVYAELLRSVATVPSRK